MDKYFKELGWNEIYPETQNRLNYFREGIRAFYPIEQISDDDLDKAIVYSFGIYGQGEVYDIWSVNRKILKEQSVKDSFVAFFNAFDEAFPETSFEPRKLIDLYIEYFYAMFIKNDYDN